MWCWLIEEMLFGPEDPSHKGFFFIPHLLRSGSPGALRQWGLKLRAI